MSATANVMKRTRQSGQTLIIALLILGVLLILGFVFLGLISRNIATGARANQRSIGNDLAEAGIRYAHGQLLRSGFGADWRVALTPNVSPRDPDYEYLKDGGPDNLGNYGRINYDQGRALVRVRYGPTDANLFSNNPTGPLILPGRAKNYIIIESLGKPGKASSTDPTIARDLNGAERERLQTRKLIAFASIGITEQAFFVTNKNNVSRPVPIGAPDNLGVRYGDIVGGGTSLVNVPTQFGDVITMPDKNGTFTQQPYGGSIFVNGDVVWYGNVRAFVNRAFGEAILASGTSLGDSDTTSQLNIVSADFNPAGNWAPAAFTLTNTGPDSLDSRNSRFSTAGNTFRDGMVTADSIGNPRGNRVKVPPSFLVDDSATGENIYRQMTRESGALLGGGNSGIYGHGRNVYVNNNADRQNQVDEQGRELKETEESLVYDWLNPNNGLRGSGWQGSFYIPRGAYLQLLPDGFLIMRDSQGPANERTWRDVNGADTSNTTARYRIVRDFTNGKLFIANTYSAFGGGTNINNATPAQIQAAGFPFDGVLYFEGNVRVRGTIPTDVQLTVVSGASVYIEGSITKGIVRTQAAIDQTGAAGQRIGTSSRSMLMLAARDYVAVNTSQFFGVAPSQTVEEVSDLAAASEYNPIRMRRNATPGTPSSYLFRSDLLLSPETGNPANPSTWKPYMLDYQEYGTGNLINSGLLITHTMDDGPATNAFISLDINFGVDNTTTGNPFDWQYLFDLNRTPAVTPLNNFDPFQTNNASDYVPYNTPGFIDPNYGGGQVDRGPIYGLGAESWQRYGRFETTFFPIAQSNGTGGGYGTFPFIPNPVEKGTYRLLAQETNDFALRFNDIGTNASNDYLIARAALVPNDVRIEASLFAEEGSFFVIPSPWFNPNPNDRRETYLARVQVVGQAQAQTERYQNFGAAPITPFYGEPVDVRVKIVGAVSQNMPAPMSQQAEWLKKWGWIPRTLGDSGRLIPGQHVPAGYDLNTDLYVPNLIITYDPALASGVAWDPAFSAQGPLYWGNPAIRMDGNRMLPPMPRLPVSPSLAYFGEVNQ